MTIAFFMLGPFPQTLKLLGAKGLIWSKAWAAIFFSAWMIEVIFRFVARLEHDGSRELNDAVLRQSADHLRWVSKLIFQLAFIVQISVWLWILIILAATPSITHVLGETIIGVTWGMASILGWTITMWFGC